MFPRRPTGPHRQPRSESFFYVYTCVCIYIYIYIRRAYALQTIHMLYIYIYILFVENMFFLFTSFTNHMCVYTYIYIYTYICKCNSMSCILDMTLARMLRLFHIILVLALLYRSSSSILWILGVFNIISFTPNPPTDIVPTNIARVKLSRKIPRKSLWAWEFHPFKLRLCWSQTLWNPQC